MSNVTRADLKDQVLRLLDDAGDIQAQSLHAKLDAGAISYQGLCRILRQLEAEGLAVLVGGYWRSMGTHKRREAEHKAFVERMERATAEREANFDAQALARLQAGPVRLSELKTIERDSTDSTARSDAWGLSDALGRLVERGLAVKVRGVVSLVEAPDALPLATKKLLSKILAVQDAPPPTGGDGIGEGAVWCARAWWACLPKKKLLLQMEAEGLVCSHLLWSDHVWRVTDQGRAALGLSATTPQEEPAPVGEASPIEVETATATTPSAEASPTPNPQSAEAEAATAFKLAPRHEKMLARLREAQGQMNNPDSSSWRGTLCELHSAGLVSRRYEPCQGGRRTVWALATTTANTQDEPAPQELAEASSAAGPQEVSAPQEIAEGSPVQAPQDEGDTHQARACSFLRALLWSNFGKEPLLSSWDRWRAGQPIHRDLARLFALAVRYRAAHHIHRESLVELAPVPPGHFERGRSLWDATLKTLDLALAVLAAPLEDLPQEVSAPPKKSPQEPPGLPQDSPKLALEDVLVPSLPVLKRCTSTARGSVCGVEAHTEDEVTSLFGWRWIGSADGGRDVPQGQCKKCKTALNAKHGKARRSKPAAPDLRQGDMLNPLPPPPPRIDHFARLRSLSALTIEGALVGEGVTVARPPKLDPEDLERLTVAGEAFVFYLRQSALGVWGVTGQTFTPQAFAPQAKKQGLGRWARAAALIVVGLGMEVHELAHGPWACMEAATREWAARLVASRTPTPDNPVANPVNVGPVESGKPVADRDRDRAPSGKRVTRGGRSAAIATGLPEVAREVRP